MRSRSETAARMSENFIKRLIFGEGICDGCGELKELAMVAMHWGGAVGYTKTRLDGTQRVIAAPRHGFCLSCALEKAARGDFGKSRKRRQKKRRVLP